MHPIIPRALLPLLLAAAALWPASARADVAIVASVPDLAALAHAIAGSHGKVQSLSLPTQDPHWVDAKPSLALQVNRADLLIAVGMELEVGWLPKLQTGSRNPKVQRGAAGFLECSAFVDALERPTGPIDRSMGDIHPGGNPHYLLDPRRAVDCARGIAERLAELDPANAGAYRKNLATFTAALAAKRTEWERRLSAYRGAPIVTYHKSWVYLSDWLGFDEVGYLEPKPGIAPTPTHVAQLIARARLRKVGLLLQESYYPSNTGKLVAGKIGARLLVLPAATNTARGQSYIAHIDELVSAIERALGSKS